MLQIWFQSLFLFSSVWGCNSPLTWILHKWYKSGGLKQKNFFLILLSPVPWSQIKNSTNFENRPVIGADAGNWALSSKWVTVMFAIVFSLEFFCCCKKKKLSAGRKFNALNSITMKKYREKSACFILNSFQFEVCLFRDFAASFRVEARGQGNW